MFKLVIQDDEGKTTVVPLIRDEITIGRKEGNTIRLTERNVSRRHARIVRNNGEVQIEDLGSYNGIRVNNARIAERVSLRVSDQVQIGDYKLYLKAEGVEQVDDARTMPIERIDTSNTATDVLPAVAPAPTVPMAVPTPAPGALPAAAQLVGNPNRTLVAVADTDPQGRPVASPAQVAAVLATPVGYGKLVVLSSNFAGKEYELSRPQMIIGRTDENDIVINHRSISRNHAKLVREPDSGRYTISDLQSSNGVRVNGQDYGKVELRRGDVVDLGHVRLRFVEPGEDFLFSRDAVITDVPDTSSKKGLWIAVFAALVVVGGVVAYMALSKDGGDKGTKGGSNEIAIADAGTVVADNPVDAAEALAEIDAAVAVAPTDDPKDRLKLQCTRAQDAKNWTDLITCAEQLRTVDPAAGKKFYETAHAELKAESKLRELDEAKKTKDLGKARSAFDAIGNDSVYTVEAKGKYDELEAEIRGDYVTRLKRYAGAKECKDFNQLLGQARKSLPGPTVDAIKREAGTCTVVVATPDRNPPKENKCANPDGNLDAGRTAMAEGNTSQALQQFEIAFNCKGDLNSLKLAFLAACKLKSVSKARVFYKKMNETTRNTWALGACANNGVYQKDLEP